MSRASCAPVSSRAPEGEEVVGVRAVEVHEFVGQLVVILQRVHERDRLKARLAARCSG